MRSLSQSSLLRYLMFGALYFAQGVPWGFISVGYLVFLADLGLDNTAIGTAMGIAYLPWSFKIIWGPLIDRFPSLRFGRRRPFIVASELLMGASLLLLGLLDARTQLELISVVLFIHNTCASMQDVAVDALAVDVLPEIERGRANSIMWAAKSLGVAAGGGGGTVLAKYIGWPKLFLLMALIIWGIMLLPLLIREGHEGGTGTGGAEPQRMNLQELIRSFSFSAPVLGIVIALLTPAGYALVGGFTTRLMRVDLKLSEEVIAMLSGVVEPVTGVVGALIGGVLADRFGIRRVMGLSMVGIAAALAVFGALPGAWPQVQFLVGWTIAFQLCVNAYSAASLGFFMTLSNPAIGATQFAIYMATTNLCYAITSPAGGRLADQLGYAPACFIAAGLQLAAVALLPLCNPHVAEIRFRGAPTDTSGARKAGS